MIYSCCAETLEFHLNFNLPVLFAFPTTLFSDLNSLQYWITSFFPSQWASPGSGSWLPAHDSHPHFIWVSAALAHSGFLPFSQLLGARMLPQPLLSRSSMWLLTRAGPSEHNKPPRWYTSLHVHYRQTNCLNRTRSCWAKLSKKAVKSLSFSTFYTHAALTDRPPSHSHSRRRCFCSIAITSIKKHGLKPFHQKTISEQFKGQNCRRRTAGTSISS